MTPALKVVTSFLEAVTPKTRNPNQTQPDRAQPQTNDQYEDDYIKRRQASIWEDF
jgi:hypothetical protein